MKTILTVLSLTMIAVSGCVQQETHAPREPNAAAGDHPFAWEVQNDVADCTEQVAVLTIDMAAAQAVLPEGYTADDAAALLDLPASTGSSAAFFNAVQCAGNYSAELAVPIVPPNIEGMDLPAVDYSLYQLAYLSSNASLAERLQTLRFPVFQGQATSGMEITILGATGRSTVEAGPLMTYAFEGVVGPEEDFPVQARFWHETDEGIVHFEYTFTSMARKGTVSSCEIAAASILHNLAGTTDCQGRQAALLAIPDQTWDGVVRFTPDPSKQ